MSSCSCNFRSRNTKNAARRSRTTKLTRRRKPERSGARNERNEAQAVGGRVQRLVVLLLIRFRHPKPETPRQSEQAAPTDRADATKY